MHRHASTLKRLWKQSFLFQFAVLALFISGTRSVIADWNYVPTGSMKPTIIEGDAVFVNRMAYDIRLPFTTISLWHRSDPRRGDIVILYSPADGQRLVKRVVGLPGDTVAQHAGVLVVNGQALGYQPREAEPLLPADENARHRFYTETLGEHAHGVMLDSRGIQNHDFAPLIVPAAHYFVMGDHRDNSADSRYFGFVERSRIVGRANAVLVSLDPAHALSPRWSRTLTSLP